LDALVLIGSCCLICLLPLSLYFLFLSHLHSRRRPMMLDGKWDFACLLLGISGFLLILGPLLLTIVDSTWRSIFVSGQLHRLGSVFEKQAILWSGLGTVYVVAMVGLLVALLRSRGRSSVIYGMPANRFDALFSATLERVRRVWRVQKNVYEIRGGRSETDVPVADANDFAEVEVDPFPSMGLVTLHWDEPVSAIRTEVELELEKTFERLETPSSPAAGWFLTASVSIFMVMLVWMAFLIYTMWTSGQRH
jgi:hypothetical protein